MVEALNIHVDGIVQGVGFRPFVYRLAKRYLINGWVLNAADGVTIHAEGESKLLDEFVMELSDNAPAAAKVTEINLKEVPLEGYDGFEIRFSDEDAVEETTLVSPDLATCDDCLRELMDIHDRRFRYPFINCTNCGPRFTIIEELPYDRPRTSMKDFPMCPQCAAEYADPGNRRFHAQPDACFQCGPVLSLAVPAEKAGHGQAAEVGVPGAAGEGAAASKEGLTESPDKPGTEDPDRAAGEEAFVATRAGEASLPALDIAYGTDREASDALFARAVAMLLEGKILAVKGLGGYHLVCDGNNADAVAELRRRKQREGKPFAVMMAATDDVRQVCRVSDEERAVLESPARPIVLLRKKPEAAFAPKLADRLSELGVMLPCTPVQHLLIHDFARALADFGRGGANPPMLVMTSGNIHDEPICISNEEAYAKLAHVADGFLGNNRAILTRFDDSVLRVLEIPAVGEPAGANAESAGLAAAAPTYAVQFIRRARGYAPVPIALDSMEAASLADGTQDADRKAGAPDGDASNAVGVSGHAEAAEAGERPVPSSAPEVIFAAGPEQKNTFTLLRGADAFVSQHIGDVENIDVYDGWLAAKDRFQTLFDMKPQALACDMHPEYLTSKWAHGEAQSAGMALTEVQHHHAHVVSVMAEYGLDEAVCGIAFDGTGYGPDGAIWGGEVLLCNRSDFERFANFSYVPMPGGAAAIKHPDRMAYGVLWAFDLLEHPAAAPLMERLGQTAQVMDSMIEGALNTPFTSSVGRLFDAASALLGVCTEPRYEGEGAVLLEAAMETAGADLPDAAAREGVGDAGRESELVAKERYAPTVTKNTATETSTAQDTSVILFDAEPTFRALLDDLAEDVPVPVIARRFHDAMAAAVVTAAEFVRAMYGIATVVLAGGVFQNRYLITQALRQLQEAGFTVAMGRNLPPNDGAVSLGEAVIAWAKTRGESGE